MERLTTDTPNGNFEIMLNFVYGKDGWAYIRHDGEHENVSLTDWAKRQCWAHGCDEALIETPDEIDQRLCDCMMDGPICPIAMAYCFASQAVHLRDRLKMYEDTGLGPEEITVEPYGCVFYCNRKCNLDGDWCPEGPGCPYEIDAEAVKHLLKLSQAEKDGRLVVLPCKVGDTVYVTCKEGYKPCVVDRMHILANCKVQVRMRHSCTETLWLSVSEFGKTVFLTREEAEAALKKREEAKNHESN